MISYEERIILRIHAKYDSWHNYILGWIRLMEGISDEKMPEYIRGKRDSFEKRPKMSFQGGWLSILATKVWMERKRVRDDTR